MAQFIPPTRLTLPKTPRQQSHTPKKRFGQNFLHDTQIIHQIVESIQLNRLDNLLEIGPGLGALTEPLLACVDKMTVIELDRDLASTLKLNIGANAHPNFTIINDNALQVDFDALHKQLGAIDKFRIVGNLPYNISTPILFHLLGYAHVIHDMHFMLQKEVVERITASPNCKDYGRLSVMMQYYCDTDYLLTVPKGAFNPPPKVTSAVFRLLPRPPINQAIDEALLALIVREVFNQRRKTLRAIFKSNAILPSLDEHDFKKMNIDAMARPEVLEVADFVRLANFITEQKQGEGL